MLIQTSFILISMFDYLYTWAIGLLRSLGLANKRAKLLLLGLDCAGKSTLLGRLATGHLHVCTPTQRATSEQLELGGITFTCHDVGGHEAAREVWADYYVDV